jgi:hypothetical protein
VLAFTVLMMVVLMGFLAFAVDLGYIYTVRTQLQRSADASALAGALSLYHPHASLENAAYTLSPDPAEARQDVRRFVQRNPAGALPLDVIANEGNDPSGDIVLGRLYNPSDRTEPLDTLSDTPNSIRVHVPLMGGHPNGAVPTFFARVLGQTTVDVNAMATATVWCPALLPFATSIANWQSLAQDGPA